MPDTPSTTPAGGTVSFRTLGCKLNQCETAQMEESLVARGFKLVPWPLPADVRVLNTCTVTAKTDRACRNEIGRVKRADPDSRLVVTGCYAQVAADRIAAIPGVDLVLGNLDKTGLADHLEDLLGTRGTPRTSETFETFETTEIPAPPTAGAPAFVTAYSAATTFNGDFVTHFSGYTRAFLKVQNGCDSRCSYCVIPIARGPSRSMPAADVIEQVRLLNDRGYKEIVLTGIHLGRWGRDTGEGSLADLLTGLMTETHTPRFRLSSIEPLEMDDRLIETLRGAGERFAEHFHLPLQSGSDSVLQRMNRPYSVAGYAERVRAVRAAFPQAAIGADVIVGYPGETDAEFEQTCETVQRLPLTYLHVFPYSDRPGTAASRAPDKITPAVTAERSARLREMGRAKDAAFQERFRDREAWALVLRQRSDDGRLVALTGNYIEVLVEGDDRLLNQFASVIPRHRRADGRWEGETA